MAILVNYEGAYVEPQKLWYLVDGVWKEVLQVFESPIQNEIAIADQERIKLDQTVLGLSTLMETLNAQISGTNPTIPMLTDPIKIAEAQKQIEISQLQLNVAKVEQVIVTKELFEQKAQLEYKKLILQGEIALEKITTVVDIPDDWGVIRLDPQSTLDERLEVAIAHELPTTERLFSYGSMQYRLYKLDQIKPEDQLAYLADNFKRRLAKADYAAGTVATNYIMRTQTIREVFTEINSFVNSGAKRIEDYLFSLKEQSKYILDGLDAAQDSLIQLEAIQTPNVDGTFPSVNSGTDINLGSIILKSQGVDSFDKLVTSSIVAQIDAGTVPSANYPGYTKVVVNQNSLDEKIYSLQEFLVTNEKIQSDIVTNKITFSNLNVLSTEKVKLNDSKALFWSSPLGSSTIANKPFSYAQGYTSSGTYVFKPNELVKLRTEYVAIISTILSHTQSVVLGVSTGTSPVRIIQVMANNTFTVGPEVDFSFAHPSIVNVKASVSAEPVFLTRVNDKEQPHPAVPFVKQANALSPDDMVDLSFYNPVINSVFVPTTYDFDWSPCTSVTTAVFDMAFNVSVLEYNIPDISSFTFNAKETTSEYIRMTNIVSFVEADAKTLLFNTRVTNSEYERLINVVSFIEADAKLLSFNLDGTIPLSSDLSKYDSAIVTVIETNLGSFNFNCAQTRSKPLNGYSQATTQATTGTIGTIQEISIDDETLATLTYHKLEDRAYIGRKTQNVITSQTGLVIIEISSDLVNLDKSVIPRILTASGLRIIEVGSDLVNIQRLDVIRNTSRTGQSQFDVTSDLVNIQKDGVTRNTTLILDNSLINNPEDSTNTVITSTEKVNKDAESIISFGVQLNPGVILS